MNDDDVSKELIGLHVRVKALEDKLELLLPSPKPPSSSSQSVWVLKQTLEAKKELAKSIFDQYAMPVADGVKWRDEEHRKQHRRLQIEIRGITEAMAK